MRSVYFALNHKDFFLHILVLMLYYHMEILKGKGYLDRYLSHLAENKEEEDEMSPQMRLPSSLLI